MLPGRLLTFRRDRSPLPLALFRVSFSAVSALDAIQILSRSRIFFEDLPYRVRAPSELTLPCAAWLCSSLLLALGIWTRIVALVSYVLVVSIVGLPGAHAQIAQDSILIASSLLLALTPSGDRLSLDAWLAHRLGRPPVTATAPWDLAFAALLAFVYVDAGVGKLASEMWTRGLGSWLPAMQPNLVWVAPGLLAKLPRWVLLALNHGVILLELGFPLLLALGPAWRWLALGSGALMHVCIGFLYPLPMFSAYMLCLYIPLLPLESFKAKSAGIVEAASVNGAFACVVAWLAMGAVTTVMSLSPERLTIASLWLRGARDVLYPLAGISHHGVFSDRLFTRYNYQIRIRRDDVTAPYGPDGLFLGTIRDRTWEHWWKRTQAPWVPVPTAERELVRWASYYAGKDRRGEPVTFSLEARQQSAWADHWLPELWQMNQSSPWHTIGTVRVGLQSGSVEWVCPVNRSRRLGEHMLDCLKTVSAQ